MATFHVEVVAADAQVWAGDATQLIVRTVEGDVGVLPGHTPMLAVLVPCAAEIVSANGYREIIAIDGGFLSVVPGAASIIAQAATLSSEISADDARDRMAHLSVKIDSGDATEEDMHRYHMCQAQLAAVEKMEASSL